MKKGFKYLAHMTLVGSLVFSMALPVFADPATETVKTKEEAQSAIESLESEKSTLESKLAELKANKTDTEAYIAQLDEQLEGIKGKLETATKDLKTVTDELKETQVNLDAAKAKEEAQYVALKERLKVMYETGEDTFLQVLLQSTDLASFLNNTEYMSSISKFDEELLNALNKTKLEIAAYEEALAEKKIQVEEAKAELEIQQEDVNMIAQAKAEELGTLAVIIDDTNEEIASVEEDIDAEQSIIAAIEEAEARAAAIIAEQEAAAEAARQEAEAAAEAERLAAEQKRQEAEEASRLAEEARQEAERLRQEAEQAAEEEKERLEAEADEKDQEADDYDQSAADKEQEANDQEQNAGGSSDSSFSGYFTWPLPGNTYISSDFGSRNCPFHGPEFHNGVDIPANSGTSVLAAASGTVVIAEYNSSLGNYIMINHGDGYVTYYLHNSALYVSPGQTVSQGEVISAVGSTGDSTGPHLDFRIKIYDSYVNPVAYATPY